MRTRIYFRGQGVYIKVIGWKYISLKKNKRNLLIFLNIKAALLGSHCYTSGGWRRDEQ